MTFSAPPFRPLPAASRPATRGHGDACLQSYVRHLHETRTRQTSDGEPVRGQDPWIGLLV